MPTTSMTLTALHPPRSARAVRLAAAALLAVATLAGCSPERLAGNDALPPDVPDPATTHTPAGALAMYRGAIVQLRSAFGGRPESFVPITGLLTDEVRSNDVNQSSTVTDPMLIDSRFLPEDPGIGGDSTTPEPIRQLYGYLQKTRGQAREARGALRAYAPDSSSALTGHLDAVEGYADVFLADLFCSGVPLSTLDFDGDFTYAAGSSTEEVYERAIALFDSALALSSDSMRIMNLARVGKGRALLALGRYGDAAQAVADVPDDFQYALRYDNSTPSGTVDVTGNRTFAYQDFGSGVFGVNLTMTDAEGGNGLPFISSRDPRSAWVNDGVNHNGVTRIAPAKYSLDGSGSIVLADGIEARLIEAEAQLNGAAAGDWLATLNALRTDGTFDTQRDPVDTTKTDTLWHAGKGGVAGLAPLTDPGTPEGRVDILFQERGYWLFLTGHRQGDLRRLIRQYGRQAERVYPTGAYPGAFNAYGSDVTAPIPGAERVNNPLFTGCRSRGA
ncbi:MAG: hypothetical protein IRY91_03985 [Gemmatimonadaceae bacterium]|nr:hypothetical protein [Gemmatimonadaceae bacterium]